MRDLAGPADAHAGIAALSWSREGQQTDRSFLAPGATPLFLRLEGVQDVAALGVDLRWWPNELVGPCYFMTADTTTVPDCGGLSWTVPAGGIDGDSSYTSSLVFVPGADRTCVTYWVRGENCAQRPATFCLTAVKVQHSDGSIEDVEVVSGATLLGGVEEGCPLLAQAVSPDTIQSGGSTSLSIFGSGFEEGATVQLVLGETTLEASGTTLVSPQHLQASFEIQSGLTGLADVVIDEGAGEADTLAQALTILGPEPPPYHPNTVIVKFRHDVLTIPPGMTTGDLASQVFEPEAVEGFLTSLGVTTVTRIAAASAAIGPGGPALPDSSILDYFLLTLADTNVVAVRGQLEADSDHVESALLNDNGVWCGSGLEGGAPSDLNFSQQWWLNNRELDARLGVVRDGIEDMDLRALEAWPLHPQGAGPTVRVVVIDSGVDTSNPDLPNVDVLGPNLYTGIPPASSSFDDAPLGHGTSVCGMISAPTDDSPARDPNVAGVSGAARITSIKLGNASQQFFVSDAMQALDWVFAQVPDCRVLTLAFAFPDAAPNPDLKLFLIRLWRRGVLIVGSSCNQDGSTLPQPAAYAPYVYAVGAFDWRGGHWRDVNVDWATNNVPPELRPSPLQGSSVGAGLQVVGPGGRYIQTAKKGSSRVYSPIGGTSFGFGGTSAATAAIAGGAAHLCSYLLEHGRPVAGEDLAAIFNLTAHNIGLPGWDPETGHGRIHLGDALRMVQPVMRFEHGLALAPALVGAGQYLIGSQAWILDGYGNYIHCDSIIRYRVRLRGAFAQPFASTPTVWARSAASVGFQKDWIPGAIIEPGSVWAPWAEVVSASADSITMETYIYTLGKKGTAIEVWFPDDWTFAAGAYTAVGVSPGVGIGPAGDVVVAPGLRGGPVPARHFVDLSFPSHEGTVPVVAIFDIHGRMIRQVRSSLGDGPVSSARWDLLDDTGARVSPGVYFARLQVGRQVLSTRLVVLR